MTQEEQRAIWREEYRKYHPIKPPRTFYSPKMGRVVTRDHYATRIFWNKDMLDFLRDNFATMLNDELAGCLGVSPRTMIRKARELGLQKDAAWLRALWDERRMMAHAVSKKLGYPGSFQKGQHASPETEFKPKKQNDLKAIK